MTADEQPPNEWQPIETVPRGDGGCIKPCLLAKKQSWGWEQWVGQCEPGDVWLVRNGNGSQLGPVPTHWKPLSAPPD